MRVVKHLLNESVDAVDEDEVGEDERPADESPEPALLVSFILKLLSLRSYERNWSFF
jgi:hypothetical protein